MNKIHEQNLSLFQANRVGKAYIFHCPGCGNAHFYAVGEDGKHPSWAFNGNMEYPSFSPSLRAGTQCHLYIESGKIRYLDDCKHDLAGKTIDMVDFDS